MKVIFKYIIPITGCQIAARRDAVILSVQSQFNEIALWVELDETMLPENWTFLVVGTGETFPGDHMKYIGTVQIGRPFEVSKKPFNYVWHVYKLNK